MAIDWALGNSILTSCPYGSNDVALTGAGASSSATAGCIVGPCACSARSIQAGSSLIACIPFLDAGPSLGRPTGRSPAANVAAFYIIPRLTPLQPVLGVDGCTAATHLEIQRRLVVATRVADCADHVTGGHRVTDLLEHFLVVPVQAQVAATVIEHDHQAH